MNYLAQLMPVLLHCVLLLPQNAPPPLQPQQSQSNDITSNNEKPSAGFGGLDGSWEGELTFLQGATLHQTQAKTGRYRITIQGTSVRVYFILSDDVRESKSGKFHMEYLMTNAVIFATDSGKDNEGTWVETWVFSLTEKDKDTLLVNFSRMVNNIDLPLTSDHSKVALEATGELKRLPPHQRVQGTVQVSSAEMGELLVKRVRPEYPDEARAKRIQGTVMLRATVSREGNVKEVSVISGDPELSQAALSAAKKWEYRPYLLEGEPVEVETTIQMNFQLSPN